MRALSNFSGLFTLYFSNEFGVIYHECGLFDVFFSLYVLIEMETQWV